MSALEERQLEQALTSALERKRDNFVADHGLAERPAFVWQCLPVDPCRVDVSAEEVRSAVLTGVGDGVGSNDAWWYGFRSSYGARPVFDGLASTGGSDDSGWTAELHVDGHLVAGLWNFPNPPAAIAGANSVVGWFHAEAFEQFGDFAYNVYEAAKVGGPLALTCTVLNANSLPLVGKHWNLIAPAPRRRTLSWQVRTVKTPQQLKAVGAEMAVRFLGAYGKTPSATQR